MEIKKAPVSVIVPCHNCEETISRAVRSVAGQTLKPGEVILVNDASTDGTAKAINDLESEFGSDWIKILTLPENGGPARARNAGWDMAAFPFVSFLDSDDSWQEKKTEIQYGYMAEHPEIAMSGTRCFWSAGDDDLPKIKAAWRPVSKSMFMFISHYFVTSAVMVKKNIPSRFPDSIRYGEDRFLWMKIMAEGGRAAYLDAPLARQYKFPYGQSGLAGNLWKMEKGELAGFAKLRRIGLLNGTEFLACSVFSIAKFFRRILIVFFGKIRSRRSG